MSCTHAPSSVSTRTIHRRRRVCGCGRRAPPGAGFRGAAVAVPRPGRVELVDDGGKFADEFPHRQGGLLALQDEEDRSEVALDVPVAGWPHRAQRAFHVCVARFGAVQGGLLPAQSVPSGARAERPRT
jgi:hypothetical protein